MFINDSTPWDVIFNVGGNVQSSGGSSTYPTMDGIFLAQGSISLTAGYVTGEIISSKSINIASTGYVDGNAYPTPDTLNSAALLGLACAGLVGLSRSLRKGVALG